MKTFLLGIVLFLPSLAIFANNNIFVNVFGLVYTIVIISVMKRKAWGKRIFRQMYKISLLLER